MEDYIRHHHKNKITQMWKNVEDKWDTYLNNVFQNISH